MLLVPTVAVRVAESKEFIPADGVREMFTELGTESWRIGLTVAVMSVEAEVLEEKATDAKTKKEFTSQIFRTF